MNNEVFLSILAMDSYQRGYAVGIKEVNGTKIGNATISTFSNISKESAEYKAGFFAQSYNWNGTTVISYRGTDFDAANGKATTVSGKIEDFKNSEYYKDLVNGWTTFLTAGLPAQFTLARQFFTAVTGRDFSDGTAAGNAIVPNTIVTGHSLGGALAGFVDARTNVQSFLVGYILNPDNDNAYQRIAA